MDIRPYPIPSEMTYFDIIAVKLKKNKKKTPSKDIVSSGLVSRLCSQTQDQETDKVNVGLNCFMQSWRGIEITLPGLTKYCFEMTWEANDCLQMSEKCTVSSYGGFIPDIFARVLSFGASKNNTCFNFASHKTTVHNTESLVNPKWSRCDILKS